MDRYALCKHGPRCSRRMASRRPCGFAHALHEVCVPDQVLHRRRWIDDSHLEKGHPGIDFFFGQRYTFAQHCRILLYVAHGGGGVDVPDWVNRYLWFIRHSMYQPRSETDLGLLREVQYLKNVMPSNCCIPDCDDALGLLGAWNPPFTYAVDGNDLTLQERLRSRTER